jgi:hypothetical protein
MTPGVTLLPVYVHAGSRSNVQITCRSGPLELRAAAARTGLHTAILAPGTSFVVVRTHGQNSLFVQTEDGVTEGWVELGAK